MIDCPLSFIQMVLIKAYIEQVLGETARFSRLPAFLPGSLRSQ